MGEMSDLPEPTNLSTTTSFALTPLVIGGKWHEPDKPVKHAAFRMAYIMISERYHPSAVYSSLCTVFRDTGLLTDAECKHVVNVSCGFAGMDVQGTA